MLTQKGKSSIMKVISHHGKSYLASKFSASVKYHNNNKFELKVTKPKKD